MNVAQFFHVCRSAAAIAEVDELPSSARPSTELDLDVGSAELTDLVDTTIGELSLFHETHGVYAHGVSLEAFVAPPDWLARASVFSEPKSGTRVRVPRDVRARRRRPRSDSSRNDLTSDSTARAR